jgi:hypothetical protein
MVFPFSGWNFGALARRLAFDGGRAWSAAAAIVGEIAEQGVHRFELRRVDHGATIAAHSDETSRSQPVKMKRKRVRCEIEGGGDRTGWHALGTGFNQQPEDIKAIILGESGQGRNDICLFHISTIIELISHRQLTFRQSLK